MRKVLLPIDNAGIGRQASTRKVPPELSLRVDCIPATITDFSQRTSNETRASRQERKAVAKRAKLAFIPTYEPRYERMKSLLNRQEAPRGLFRKPCLAGMCVLALAVFGRVALDAQDN